MHITRYVYPCPTFPLPVLGMGSAVQKSAWERTHHCPKAWCGNSSLKAWSDWQVRLWWHQSNSAQPLCLQGLKSTSLYPINSASQLLSASSITPVILSSTSSLGEGSVLNPSQLKLPQKQVKEQTMTGKKQNPKKTPNQTKWCTAIPLAHFQPCCSSLPLVCYRYHRETRRAGKIAVLIFALFPHGITQ